MSLLIKFCLWITCGTYPKQFSNDSSQQTHSSRTKIHYNEINDNSSGLKSFDKSSTKYDLNDFNKYNNQRENEKNEDEATNVIPSNSKKKKNDQENNEYINNKDSNIEFEDTQKRNDFKNMKNIPIIESQDKTMKVKGPKNKPRIDKHEKRRK